MAGQVERRTAGPGRGCLLLLVAQGLALCGCYPRTVTLRPEIDGVVLDGERRRVAGARVESCSTEHMVTGPTISQDTDFMRKGCLQRDTVYTDRAGSFSLPRKRHWFIDNFFGEYLETDHPSTVLIVCGSDGSAGDSFVSSARYPKEARLEIVLYGGGSGENLSPQGILCRETAKQLKAPGQPPAAVPR